MNYADDSALVGGKFMQEIIYIFALVSNMAVFKVNISKTEHFMKA